MLIASSAITGAVRLPRISIPSPERCHVVPSGIDDATRTVLGIPIPESK